MAESLDRAILLSDDGYPTVEFEDYWFGVTLLVSGEPGMDMNLQVFQNGKASIYFESLWNGVAAKLTKEDLDINVILNIDGYASPEFEDVWEDLIT